MAEDIAGQPERTPPRAPMGGRQARWPFAVALSAVVVLVLVVVGVNVLAGNGTTGSRQQGTGLTSSGAVACPEFYEHVQPSVGAGYPWVPAKPAGVHSKHKMVPKLHPTHVTICEYLGKNDAGTTSLRLSGHRDLTGKLDQAADTLRRLPAAPGGRSFCASTVTPANSNQYLIGLRYAEAIVWVSAPVNHCAGTSNGRFYSAKNISAVTAASYAAGTWVSSPN